MSEDRLAEIKARCEAATPGPWGYDGQHDEITADSLDASDYWLIVSQCRTAPNEAPSDEFGHQYSADFAFIAAAREDVPYLLTEVERLRADVARLEGELKHARTTVREARAFCDSQLGPCRAEDTTDGRGCGLCEVCPFPWAEDTPWMRLAGEEPNNAS